MITAAERRRLPSDKPVERTENAERIYLPQLLAFISRLNQGYWRSSLDVHPYHELQLCCANCAKSTVLVGLPPKTVSSHQGASVSSFKNTFVHSIEYGSLMQWEGRTAASQKVNLSAHSGSDPLICVK